MRRMRGMQNSPPLIAKVFFFISFISNCYFVFQKTPFERNSAEIITNGTTRMLSNVFLNISSVAFSKNNREKCES